ncbi:hypothetical protein [Henriciella sp.]|uniref:MotE family protein n=1 Tax=Henriciella sp. TaxID=1968823 RepID=UPI00261637C0|nr:hypothetical protein [Henriciella sp.]
MAGKTRSHVLLTLGVLFTVAGLTRIIPDTLAEAENSPASAEDKASSEPELIQASYMPGPDGDTASDEVCFTGAAATAMAKDQETFRDRSQALQEQELSLQARQQELERQGDELKALQATLDERWQEMTSSANQDIKHLADMYSSMKPDQAAAIFNQMDPSFAAGFLRLMPSDQAGGILAGMETSKAYVVSVRLASKNEDIRAAKQQAP